MKVYRHGDILIASVETIPGHARSRPGLVLAYGEVTGHSHRVETEGRAQLLELGGLLFLSIEGEPARLVHEEHDTIVIEPGTYRVWRQREYLSADLNNIVED